ncbi:MAG TPA: energy transducer TonB [Candidatus Krumholzibacteria bacterium]|nr:energy transducer TonB [Candidatus Krumholzibacteria bacterium]HRX50116.1 energy transducer TonB [Candidatus Krumholzibacteria bacterium]
MPNRRTTVWAFLAALVLHGLVLLLTWNLDLIGEALRPAAPSARAPQEDVVEMVLVPDDPLFQPDGPRAFTSVPERQEVEAPPENPDFLAAVNSRAADLLEGGEAGSKPGTETPGEVEQVAIRQDTGGGAPGGAVVLRPRSQMEDGAGGEADQGEEASRGRPEAGADPLGVERSGPQDGRDGMDPQRKRGEESGAPDLAELPARSVPSILAEREGLPGDRGFTYDQRAVSAGGNMVQFGDFALNTVEWEFAPWLERFKNDFLPHWIPPYAYRLGVIDGKTVLRLVVEKDGTIGSLDVIDKEGHESLHQASTSALRATAPFAPLPPDFPEEHLVIELALHYPAWNAAAPTRTEPSPGPRNRRPR